jgi:hypothetical protein
VAKEKRGKEGRDGWEGGKRSAFEDIGEGRRRTRKKDNKIKK